MDEFLYLRQQAAKKRDAATRAAREDYNDALRRISELQRRLHGKSRKASRAELRPLRDILLEILPRDRTFTVEGAYLMLLASDPKRYFHLPTVRATFANLRVQKLVYRVTRGAKGVVQWARAESGLKPVRLSLLRLPDACESILRNEGPLRAAEISIRLQEKGYRAAISPRELISQVAGALTKNPERFTKGADRRWSVVAEPVK